MKKILLIASLALSPSIALTNCDKAGDSVCWEFAIQTESVRQSGQTEYTTETEIRCGLTETQAESVRKGFFYTYTEADGSTWKTTATKRKVNE